MDLQPTLTGPTVLLRPIRADDFPGLHAAASNPALWALHPASNRWQEAQFRVYFDTWLIRGGGLAIIDRASQRIIGASCYSTEFAAPGEVEIGWTYIEPAFWGGPTNREVKRLMICHALATFDRVIFRVAETNLRSRRALEKIGATLTEREQMVEVAGCSVRHVVYAIDREADITQEAA